MNFFRGAIRLGSNIFSAYDVEFTPHSKEFELFESYEGIIAIERKLDRHANLKFKVLLTEAILENYRYGDDPGKHREEFVKFRRSFLDDLNGKVVICASEMFPPFQGVIKAKNYRIDAGYEDAEYEIEVSEAW